MGTNTRPELSEKNKYWIEKHRYYELKHFCLQYPIWRKARNALTSLSQRSIETVFTKTNVISDPTEKCAEARIYYTDRMKMVETAAYEASPEFSDYILKAVTEGLSYDSLRVRAGIPCCKEIYYELYRRFFWILSKIRN